MRLILKSAIVLGLMAGAASAEMRLSFTWGDIPRCTTGRPNVVGNPAFMVSGVPAGTTSIEFRLKDLNVPSYKHGGKKLKISRDGTVPFGTFKYKSPCPPSGVHTYQWTATARKGGKVLERAKAQRKYPE